MTITIPLLDIVVSILAGTISLLATYQGACILFKKSNTPLFPYNLILIVASLFGKGDEIRKRMNRTLTVDNLKMQGVSGLLGGVLGLIGSTFLLIDALSRIKYL
jgi:hypothetical protein